MSVANTLGIEAARKLFNLKADASKYKLVDLVKEYTLYQLENIPSQFFLAKDHSQKGRYQESYWRYAYSVAGVERAPEAKDGEYVRIDHYWKKVIYFTYFHL